MTELDAYLRQLDNTIALLEAKRTPSDGDPFDEEPWEPPKRYEDLSLERLFVVRDIVAYLGKAEGCGAPEALDDGRLSQLVEQALDAVDAWAEGPGMDPDDGGDGPPRATDTELQRLLRRYCDIGEQMTDIFEAWRWGR